MQTQGKLCRRSSCNLAQKFKKKKIKRERERERERERNSDKVDRCGTRQ